MAQRPRQPSSRARRYGSLAHGRIGGIRANGGDDRKATRSRLLDLQLRFAEVVAARTGVDLAHAVFTHTNFFMRLSFGSRISMPFWNCRALPNRLDSCGGLRRLARLRTPGGLSMIRPRRSFLFMPGSN